MNPIQIWLAMMTVGIISSFGFAGEIQIEKVPGQAEEGTIEIHGVTAGEFQKEMWESGNFHFLPDIRSPLFRPEWDGGFRNIYAPSVVPVGDGWRVFYGAWDGSDRPNDRLYSIDTEDFLTFNNRRLVIENGPFIHVCNSHAIPLGESGILLAGTAYPDKKGLNKPIVFESPDGEAWNGEPAGVYTANFESLIPIQGYSGFEDADNNGANVFLEEDGEFHFYFFNFKDGGKIHYASGLNPRELDYQGVVLEPSGVVNDMKRFEVDGKSFYLMGLHRNGDRLFYALSDSPGGFAEQKDLFQHLDETDPFIVAHGWVTQGNRLLGVLYGAGASPALNRNRIFARWLQKKVILVDEEGNEFGPTWSLGPDRQVIEVPMDGSFKAKLRFYSEDGKTMIGEVEVPKISPGGIWKVSLAD